MKKLIFIIFTICLLFYNCQKKSPDAKYVIRYSAPGFMLYNKIREQLGKDFEKENPGVKTKYEPISGQGYFEKIQTQLAGGTEPDIFFMRDFEMPIFVQKGAILALDEFIQNDKEFDINDFHKILIDSYSMNGKIYGLPGSFTTGVIFYNKDIFERAGIEPPHKSLKWNELLKLAQRLTIKQNNIVQQFGLVLEYYDWLTFILQNKGEIFTQDKKKCIIYSNEAIEAIKFLKSLFAKYHIMPNSSDLQQSEAYQLFMTGRAAMFTGGRWYTTIFNQIKDFKWSILPFFYNKQKATRLDSHSWVISRRTKNPEICWKFLKYLTSREANWKMVEVGDSVPTHKSYIQRFLKMKPEHSVYIDSLNFAYTVDKVISPYLPWRQMQRILNEEFDKFIIDKQTPEETLKNVEKRINSIIKENLSAL